MYNREMSASENLHPQLFHGTSGSIRGGVVQPSSALDLRDGHNYAYSTPDQWRAAFIAKHKAHKEGRLFGAVYEVEPLTEGLKPEIYGDSVEYQDPKGYKVLREVESPINTRAV